MMMTKIFSFLLLLIICILPWSVDFSFPSIGVKLGFPLEVLLIVSVALFLVFWGGRLKKYPFIFQSLEFLVLLFIGWRLLSSCFSQLPIVSFKDSLAKIWFIVPAFFMGKQLFIQSPKKVLQVLKIGIFSMSLVVLAILYQRFNMVDFHVNRSWATAQPFFNDHTQYATVLTLFIPVIAYFIWDSSSKWLRLLFAGLLVLFIFALIVSLCRAALLGFLVALSVFIIFLLRKHKRLLWIGGGSFLLFFSLFFFGAKSTHIFENYGKKTEHPIANLLSITNFQKDVSSMERTNRWNCALRMYKEYPVFGVGAGTYQFLYAPYQKAEELTEISTFEGNGGNAHSEYLTALTETGTLGLLFFLALFGLGIGLGLTKSLHLLPFAPQQGYLLLALSLGLITFMVHGVVNNFLNTDKVAVIVFLFLGIIDGVREWRKGDN